MGESGRIVGADLHKMDKDALNYASCRNLPSQFACHQRSPEAIIACLKKDDVKDRCASIAQCAI